MSGKLLPADALANVRVRISASQSPDLLRLGLLESHLRLAVGEIARCVLVSGGNLAYGGHLRPDGYTAFLVKELERYARRDRPLLVCLAWTEHRKMNLSELLREIRDIGLYGIIECLDLAGNPTDPQKDRKEVPVHELNREIQSLSLTNMRRHLCDVAQGGIFIGGKREGFLGEMPGLLEEAIMSFELQQPVFLAGGFGGVTLDIVRVLGIDGDWFPKGPKDTELDKRLVDGLARLVRVVPKQGHESLRNGLTREENQRLAASHRPSEIASLVSLGLGRLFARI